MHLSISEFKTKIIDMALDLSKENLFRNGQDKSKNYSWQFSSFAVDLSKAVLKWSG